MPFEQKITIALRGNKTTTRNHIGVITAHLLVKYISCQHDLNTYISDVEIKLISSVLG